MNSYGSFESLWNFCLWCFLSSSMLGYVHYSFLKYSFKKKVSKATWKKVYPVIIGEILTTTVSFSVPILLFAPSNNPWVFITLVLAMVIYAISDKVIVQLTKKEADAYDELEKQYSRMDCSDLKDLLRKATKMAKEK